MKFSSQPAVQFNGLWKTIEQWLEGRKDFLLHAFAKPNIQLLPLLSLPISSQSCRSFVCTVYFHFIRAEIMHKFCNHSHVYLWPFLNGVCAACTTSYSTEYLYIAQNSLFFLSQIKAWSSSYPFSPNLFHPKAQGMLWHWPLHKPKCKRNVVSNIKKMLRQRICFSADPYCMLQSRKT